MQLEQFLVKVSDTFDERVEVDKRMRFAEAIAKKYKFECPALVLAYTHPKLSRLPLAQRCRDLGLSEEQYLLFASQEGFQKFVKDYHSLNINTMRTQAMESVGEALRTDRYSFDKMGNEMVDHTLEVAILKGLSEERAGPQVAVQVNNLWGAAKQRRLESRKQ